MSNNEIDKKIDDLMDLIIANDIQEFARSKVENELNEILKIEPNNTRVLYIYALYYEKFEEYQKALECYEKILQYATDEKNIEEAKDCIKNCKKLLGKEDENSQDNSVCEVPNIPSKSLGKLSPITLLVIKIIILVIFLLFFFQH